MTYLIQGRTNDWEVVIGLEVHLLVVMMQVVVMGVVTVVL
jgi:hypothetical protein